MSTDTELGINRVGDAILCYAAGESDRPCVRIAHTAAEVKQFIIDEWLGDPESDELPEIMQEIAEHDWREDGSKSWEFEIGSVQFTDIFATVAKHGTRNDGLRDAAEVCLREQWNYEAVAENAYVQCAQAIAALSSEADKR